MSSGGNNFLSLSLPLSASLCLCLGSPYLYIYIFHLFISACLTQAFTRTGPGASVALCRLPGGGPAPLTWEVDPDPWDMPPLGRPMADGGLNGHRKGRRCVWLAATGQGGRGLGALE